MAGRLLFDKFEIINCLKQDVATVYIARHVFLEKQILLKVLDTGVMREKDVLQRFQREARTLARLEHPRIIKVLDFGFQDTFFYISFEYFESQNLREVIENRELTDAEKLDLLQQLFIGLSYAHENGIVHRDIKPENILINSALELKIADFGLALNQQDTALTAQTSIVGTPGYMAPEQIRGERADARTDLFAAGILAYELFTGENPFLGGNISITLNNILSGVALDFDKPEIPGAFAEILPQLLRRNRKERISSARAVLDMMGIDCDEAAEKTSGEVSRSIKKSSLRTAQKWPWVLLVVLLAGGGGLAREWRASHQIWRLLTYFEQAAVTAKPIEQNMDFAEEMVTIPDQAKPAEETRTQAKPTAVTAENGSLWVKCGPWANIWLGERFLEATPMERPVSVPAGEYQLRFRHPKYPAYVKNIRISAGKMTTVAVNLDTLYGYFLPRIYPWGDVEIDGEARGETPFTTPLILLPGRHRLVVKNQYFEDVTRWLEISRRDTLVMELDLSTDAVRRQ